jgi:hypothetical protein
MTETQPKGPRRPWVTLIVLGLVLGGVLGLQLSRWLQPPGQAKQELAGLSAEEKEEYILLVAVGYAADQDLARARAQLDLLDVPNVEQWLAVLIDRALAEGHPPAEVQALVELAQALGVQSQAIVAYLVSLTPPATATPQPSDTPPPTSTPTATAPPPTETPTSEPATAEPSDTPSPEPTMVPTETAPPPTDTPAPQPTNSPAPTRTPAPTATPAPKWAWTASLVGPGIDGQSCNDGLKLVRVTVLDAAGGQIQGVWVHEQYSGQYQVSGHKGDDPYWGPGEVEFSGLDGARVCIATGDGGSCESDLTRDLPCHDPPPFEDLWAAGYCECCEAGISKESCQELFETGRCLGVSHYAWRVEFKRSQ